MLKRFRIPRGTSLDAVRNGLFAVLAILIIPAAIFAQTGGGTIQGTIRDANGAVVPGARVLITHNATSQVREVTTNESGNYFVSSLAPGDYTISVEATGMKRWQGEALLQVGQNMEVDASLAIGDVSADVTIAGDVSQLITTTNPTIGNTIDRTRIEQLSTNGRSLLTLVELTTPGVEGQRVNGMREAAFEFVQDGAPLVSRDFGGISARPPGLDSIQEVRIESNGSSAKFNRPATAIISTKSGTNELHGSIFETHRNNGFGVARNRQDAFDKAPQYIRNEFGASIGGPIFLPRVGEDVPLFYNGRDRSFFFLAFEGYELRQQRTVSFRVPTAAMRQGDFSALRDGNGRPIILYDPLTTSSNSACLQQSTGTTNSNPYCRTPFPNNQIPIDRISPLARAIYDITPLPTNDLDPQFANNWIGTIPNNVTERSWTGRLDHRFGGSDQVYFRYSYGTRSDNNTTLLLGPPTTDLSANITFRRSVDHSGSFSWVHTFSPTFVSETVLSHNNESIGIGTGLEPEKNWGAAFGLPNPFGDVGFPSLTNGFSSYGQGDTTRLNYENLSNLDQNFTWVRGNHHFEFGGRYRRERIHILPDQQTIGIGGNASVGATFDGFWTSLSDPASPVNTPTRVVRTGSIAADFFLGHANLYAVGKRQQWYRFLDQEIAGYFQDNWSVTKRLTLNLGLRWESHPTLQEKHNFFTGFNEKTKAIVIGQPLEELYKLGVTTPNVIKTFTSLGVKFETPEEAGLPPGLVDSNLFDFAPRIGFAFRFLGDKRPTVLRGGYSVFNYPPPTRNFYARTRFNPPYLTNFQRSWSSALQSPDGRQNYTLRSIPSLIAGLNTTEVIDANAPAAGISAGSFTVSAVGPEYPSTKVHEWNATLEKELPGNIVARFSLVGNQGTNLEQYRDINAANVSDYVWYARTGLPIPAGGVLARRPFDNKTYGMIEFQEKSGWSDSSSFQFDIQRRFAKGFGFQLFYAMTNAFRAGGNGWRDQYINPETAYAPGIVPEDFDERNRFLNYMRDVTIPKHRVRWNWLADVPIGKGKWLLGNANRWVDAILGGWQLSGNGTFRSQYFQLSTSNWVTDNAPIEIYGKKHKIQVCSRSATGQEDCVDSYLWYNGYIPPSQRNRYNNATGAAFGVFGLPDDYVPAHVPLIQEPTTGPALCGSAITNHWNSNTVAMTLNNGSCVRTGYNTGVHPWHKTFFLGPFNWNLDASLFKTLSITERVKLRINIDAFNVLNNPGQGNPDSYSGILSKGSNFNTARQLQGTLRLTF